MADKSSTTAKTKPRNTVFSGTSHARSFSAWFFLKLFLVGIVNALGIYLIWSAYTQERWAILAVSTVLLLIVDYVYFSHRAIPAKYLLPGLVFLAIYQIFVIVYTGYVSFTNYGDGHILTKPEAIERNLAANEHVIPDTPRLPLQIVETEQLLGDSTLGMAIIIDDVVHVGTPESHMEPVDDAVIADGQITEIPGHTIVDDIYARSEEIFELRVPASDDPNDGSYRTFDGSQAVVARSLLEYDEAADTMTNLETGAVYTADSSTGYFVSDDGERLPTGWRVVIGVDNYLTAFTDARYAGPFLSVLVWTVAFAFLSVATTFLFGLFLAVLFNDPRVKGQKIYRSLLILPYAFPGFLAALLWRGLLNRDFGFVNDVLLGGAAIPWLTDPWLAKLSVLGVNFWLGFPYMFLICTAALQSIPGELKEAAVIDGAGAWNQFRRITLPLVLVATTPLLISSFAFNFNNFNLIFMLTGGGPRMEGASVAVGHTDILISMVYNISGLDGGAERDYGLASALSIVIFIIVAVVSVIGFRQARKMEELV